MPNGGAKPKVLVAVHGIGDQSQYETLQLLAYRLCRYYKQPDAIPLGRFHPRAAQRQSPQVTVLQSPPDPAVPGEIGFAEVYWADIPRALVKQGYLIEESKKWAQTVVKHVSINNAGSTPLLQPEESAQVQMILGELIESVAVLERLTFFAEKAGFFKFNLRQVLEEYLNDVQVVTEFGAYREEILQKFHNVMHAIAQWNPDAEVYLVAHSEGTVVSFLGLLRALCGQPAGEWEWVKQVRGFMTFGSPLDKHLTLWPQLWDDVSKWQWQPSPTTRIQWHNYYDRADPIGFNLDGVRSWLQENRCDAFAFTADHDHGFSRSTFPGKAHTDYWRDAAVFGHFLSNVVKPIVPQNDPSFTGFFNPPLRNEKQKKFISDVLPYMLVFALLVGATAFLYKAIFAWVHGKPAGWMQLCQNVFGIAVLLSGITVLVRIPRLMPEQAPLLQNGLKHAVSARFPRFARTPAFTKMDALGSKISARLPRRISARGWHVTSILLFFLSIAGFYGIASPEVRTVIGAPIAIFSGELIPPAWAAFLLVVVLGVVAYQASVWRPEWGAKPLIAIGCLASFGVVGVFLLEIAQNKTRWAAMVERPMWPVLLAAIVFVYLWWLAALVFDLAFVWHLYIKKDSLMKVMKHLAEHSRSTRGESSPPAV